MYRVRCPKCETAIIHQLSEDYNKEDDSVTVTYVCGGCKITFCRDYIN